MAKNILLLSLATFFVLLQSAYAAEFLCPDEPAICKTKFSKQFESDFKELHLDAIRKLLDTFINFANSLVSNLPYDEPYAKQLREAGNIVEKNLKKLDDNLDDVAKIKEAIVESMTYIIAGMPPEGVETHSETRVAHYMIEWHLSNIIDKMKVDTVNLWADMYNGLRDIDLKAYPEFSKVNEFIQKIRGNGNIHYGDIYMDAMQQLALNFDLPYIEAVIV